MPACSPRPILAATRMASTQLKDVVNYFKGVIGGDDFFGQALDGPMMRVDMPALGTDFSIPFFVVEGAEDDITPASLAKAYFPDLGDS